MRLWFYVYHAKLKYNLSPNALVWKSVYKRMPSLRTFFFSTVWDSIARTMDFISKFLSENLLYSPNLGIMLFNPFFPSGLLHHDMPHIIIYCNNNIAERIISGKLTNKSSPCYYTYHAGQRSSCGWLRFKQYRILLVVFRWLITIRARINSFLSIQFNSNSSWIRHFSIQFNSNSNWIQNISIQFQFNSFSFNSNSIQFKFYAP